MAKAQHTATGRIGRIVNVIPVGVIWEDDTRSTVDMYELAFDGQLWTECFSIREIQVIEEADGQDN